MPSAAISVKPSPAPVRCALALDLSQASARFTCVEEHFLAPVAALRDTVWDQGSDDAGEPGHGIRYDAKRPS
jgi:hypothetical protein